MQQTAPSPHAAKPPRLYRSFWLYAAGDRLRVVHFMTMLILAQLLKLAIPYLSGKAVSAMQGVGGAALGTAGWDMALIFVVCAASWLLHGPARVLERFVAIRVRERFADTLYVKASALPLDWHQRHHSGETIEHVQKAGGALPRRRNGSPALARRRDGALNPHLPGAVAGTAQIPISSQSVGPGS